MIERVALMAAERGDERLGARIACRIQELGPIPVSEYVEACLYDADGGFYMRPGGGRAGGRSGHFLTAPEVGPLFGAVLARALDAWWTELGEPDPFMVMDWGAGPGTLARSVLAAEPRCMAAGALRLVLVELSPAQRALHPDHPMVTSVSRRCREAAPSGRACGVWSWPTNCLTTCPSTWFVAVPVAGRSCASDRRRCCYAAASRWWRCLRPRSLSAGCAGSRDCRGTSAG